MAEQIWLVIALNLTGKLFIKMGFLPQEEWNKIDNISINVCYVFLAFELITIIKIVYKSFKK